MTEETGTDVSKMNSSTSSSRTHTRVDAARTGAGIQYNTIQ